MELRWGLRGVVSLGTIIYLLPSPSEIWKQNLYGLVQTLS